MQHHLLKNAFVIHWPIYVIVRTMVQCIAYAKLEEPSITLTVPCYLTLHPRHAFDRYYKSVLGSTGDDLVSVCVFSLQRLSRSFSHSAFVYSLPPLSHLFPLESIDWVV